jgi:hypothetical protein
LTSIQSDIVVKLHEKNDPHHQAKTAMAAPSMDTITPYSSEVAPSSEDVNWDIVNSMRICLHYLKHREVQALAQSLPYLFVFNRTLFKEVVCGFTDPAISVLQQWPAADSDKTLTNNIRRSDV